MTNPPSISELTDRTQCKHGHDLVDAYIYPRTWTSRKTGASHVYWIWLCRTCVLERSRIKNRARGIRSRPVPVMPTDKITLAYAAGLFDGEGHVGIRLLRKKGHTEKRYHSVVVAIASTDRAIMDWLQVQFGGTVNANHKENAGRNYKDAWKWQLLARHAAAFLEAVRPYLIVKQKQAAVALELRDEMGDGRSRPITPELFAKREALAQELKWLNRRGRDTSPDTTDQE